MPSVPQSLLWISLVVLWLFVLVPMLISKRDAVRRTSDVALATRVLNSGGARRLRRGPAAGHRSDPDWRPAEDLDDELNEDEMPPKAVVVTGAAAVVAVQEPDYLDVDVVEEHSVVLSVGVSEAVDRPQPQEPVSEEPVAAEPVGQEPVAEEPQVEEPVTEELVTEEPVTEEPVTEELVAEGSGAEEGFEEGAEDAAATDFDTECVQEECVEEESVEDAGAEEECVEESHEPVASDGTEDEYEYVEDTSGLESEDEPPTTVSLRSSRRRAYESKTAAVVSARKYKFRRRTVLVMALVLAVSAIGAFTVWPDGKWLCATAGVITVLYLAYLRRQTRIEERLRRRRQQRMARSRLGVENAGDREFDVVPSRLRRPGAAVLEIDDEDPTFEHLDDARGPMYYHLPRAAGQ